jgi:uncharacterized protein YlxW (UPF0749 family)
MATREVQRARITAIVFGTLTSISLIAFVFAFTQQGVAKKNAFLARQHAENARQCEERNEQMQILVEQQRNELQKKNEALAQELLMLRNGTTR